MYRSEGLRLSVELEVPQYLAHINQRLTEEHERIIHYLDNSTKLVKNTFMIMCINHAHQNRVVS